MSNNSNGHLYLTNQVYSLNFPAMLVECYCQCHHPRHHLPDGRGQPYKIIATIAHIFTEILC